MKGKNILRIVLLLLFSGLLIMSCSKKSDDPTPDKPNNETPTQDPSHDTPGTTPEKPNTDPEKPSTDPEKPNTDPEKPSTDPEKPNTDPEKPSTDPEKPNTDPEKPSTDPEKPNTDPEKPGTDPDKPAPTDPVNPGPTDPENPGTTDPVNPGPTDPENPGTTDPVTPGPTEPENPGTTDPVTPGPAEPENPGTTDPETPIEIKFTVSYDAAGGNNTPVSVEVVKGESVNLDNGSSISRDKYEFKGWKGSNGNTYAAGDKVVVNEDLTFTAIWEAIIQQYSVKYDANGGKGTVPGAQKVNENSSVSLFDGSSLTMTDHIFDGWQGSDGKTYQSGDNYTVTGDVTFTAIWKENYSLCFHGNGYNGTMPASVKFENGKATVPNVSFSREGFQFLGWSMDRDARIADYKAGDAITSNNGSLTLFAVWKADKFTYTFCWNFTNTKSKKSLDFSGKDIQNGKATFANVNYTNLPEGHVFIGWKCDDSDKIYSEKDLFDVLANRTFYPVSAPKAEANQMESWIINKY